MSNFEYWALLLKYGFLIVLIIGGVTLIAGLINPVFGFFTFISLIAFLLYVNATSKKENEFVKDAIHKAAWRHRETLARKRRRLVETDDYGNPKFEKWISEIDYFLDHVVASGVPADKANALASYPRVSKIEIIDGIVRDVKLPPMAYSPEFTPEEFEEYVSEVLAELGWSTRAVGRSGDQGADVFASKNGVSVVIQCKKYSSPVGNFAVQEAFAAKAHYSANIAAVVSNAEFTVSARELASSTGVLLINIDDIYELDALASRQ